MGQKVSKRIVVPKLTNAMKSYEAEVAKEAINDIATRKAIAKAKGQKYIDPSAESGFKRDTWKEDEGFVKELYQRDFLKSQQEGVQQEMPKDLVDFLNDAGPLEREVSKEFTSDKVYDSLLEEDEQRRQLREEARQRKRRRMPMVENMQAENRMMEEEGMTVERTTNFSSAVKEENEYEIRLNDGELFDLVWKLQNNETTIEKYLLEEKDMKLESNSTSSDSNDSGESEPGQSQMEENLTLLENMKQYNGIPILMQDADRALIGAPPDNVETLKYENVRMAPSHIQLSFIAEATQEKLRNRQLKGATIVK